MIELPITDIYLGMMAFTRVGALIFMIPMFSSMMVPLQFRTALTGIIAIMLVPVLYSQFTIPQTLSGLAWAVLGEVTMGILMGLAVRTIFFAVEFATHILAMETALMRSSSFDPTTQEQSSTIGPLYFYLTAIILFVTGTHLEILGAFVRSYDYVPAGMGMDSLGGVSIMTSAFNDIFVLGLRIAAPLVALAFIINLLFAIFGRIAPKVNVLILSFGVRILLGLLMISLTVELAAEYLIGHSLNLTELMLRFIVE